MQIHDQPPARPDTIGVEEGTPPGGLSAAQAASRLALDGPNAIPTSKRVGLAVRMVRELREPMAVLLMVAATISGVLLGEALDAIAIITIVVVNAVIALVQQGRAEQALDALRALESPTAVVLRDGLRQVVPAADLVAGDVVEVQAGDRVPADVRLTVTDGLEVDEAILTGESMPMTKRAHGEVDLTVPVGDRDGMLHNGTLVQRGSGRGEVSGTGSRTVLGGIAGQLHDLEREPTPLQRQLSGLTRWLGVAALVAAVGMFALATLSGITPEEAFLTAVALAVAAVPEGLAAVTTVGLSLGVGRMARRGAIIRRLPAVETLGAVDVLVIDKTGTVTENRMAPVAVIGADGTVLSPEGVPAWLAEALDPVRVLCNDATLVPPTGDPTEQALLEGIDPAIVVAQRHATPRLTGTPFSSDRRRMSSVHLLATPGTGGSRQALLMKGAPEVILPLCSDGVDADGVAPLDVDGLLERGHRRAERGERVLALGMRWLDADAAGLGVDEVEGLEHDLTLVALVALRDPPRPSAAGSVAAARQAGITLLMATGDHPATAEAIAEEVGVGSGPALTGVQLRDVDVDSDPVTVSRYARVEPDQKLQLVTRLQAHGHVVGMTGDGVNDAPALRRADIGVALGATGSDVAREAADMVITDDDLATIVAAVREGRGIYDNLRKVVDFLVTSNLSEVSVMVGTLLIAPGFGVPLFPLQLLWINLLTDGLPALALGVDPYDSGLMGRPPRPGHHRLLDAALLRRLGARSFALAGASLGSFVVATRVLGMEGAVARTVLFSTLVLTQVLYSFVVSSDARGNRWLLRSAVGAMALQVLIVVAAPAQRIFDTATLPAQGWLLVVAGGVLGPAVLAVVEHRRRARATAAV